MKTRPLVPGILQHRRFSSSCSGDEMSYGSRVVIVRPHIIITAQRQQLLINPPSHPAHGKLLPLNLLRVVHMFSRLCTHPSLHNLRSFRGKFHNLESSYRPVTELTHLTSITTLRFLLIWNLWNCESTSRHGGQAASDSRISERYFLRLADEWWRVVFIILKTCWRLQIAHLSEANQNTAALARRSGLGWGVEALLSRWMRGMIDFSGGMNPAPAWRSTCQNCNLRPAEGEILLCLVCIPGTFGKNKVGVYQKQFSLPPCSFDVRRLSDRWSLFSHCWWAG